MIKVTVSEFVAVGFSGSKVKLKAKKPSDSLFSYSIKLLFKVNLRVGKSAEVPIVPEPTFCSEISKHLDWFADHRRQHARTDIPILQHYTYAFAPKKSGPPRLIECPKPKIKALHRRILHEILHSLPTHESEEGAQPAGSDTFKIDTSVLSRFFLSVLPCAHRLEEIPVCLGLLQPVDKELDSVLRPHRIKDPAQDVRLR